MLQQIIPSFVQEETGRLYGDAISLDDFRARQRLARHVARRYGHSFCREFTFSDQCIADVGDRILGIAVTEALRAFEPERGVKFTTFLYRILRFHAIKEYRAILLRRLVEFDSEVLIECEGVSDKGLDRVETADAIRFYSTIPDLEIASTKRQYLPAEYRGMDDTLLKRTLGELDREILQRLDEGESYREIRRDFQQRGGMDQRKFYRSRCMAIVRRGLLEKTS